MFHIVIIFKTFDMSHISYQSYTSTSCSLSIDRCLSRSKGHTNFSPSCSSSPLSSMCDLHQTGPVLPSEAAASARQSRRWLAQLCAERAPSRSWGQHVSELMASLPSRCHYHCRSQHHHRCGHLYHPHPIGAWTMAQVPRSSAHPPCLRQS